MRVNASCEWEHEVLRTPKDGGAVAEGPFWPIGKISYINSSFLILVMNGHMDTQQAFCLPYTPDLKSTEELLKWAE